MTWIGAQVRFGASSPFVQVGTVEESSDFANPPYFAFWSDTGHRFLPVYLGLVHPDDFVVASMKRVRNVWRVALDDLTTHTRETARSSEGRSAPFALAEWFQENPNGEQSDQRLPYPALSRVRFERLALNGKAPLYANVYSQWLSLPGGRNLAPTPLSHDAFSLRSASLSRAGTQYMSDYLPVDAAYGTLLAEIARWTPRTTAAQAAAQADALANVSATEDQRLLAQHWSPSVRDEIPQVVARQRAVIAELHEVGRLPPSQRASWDARLLRDVQAHREAEHLLTRALRVPEYVPAP